MSNSTTPAFAPSPTHQSQQAPSNASVAAASQPQTPVAPLGPQPQFQSPQGPHSALARTDGPRRSTGRVVTITEFQCSEIPRGVTVEIDLDIVIEHCRAKVFRLSIAEVVLGAVCVPLCWLAYGFTAMLAMLLLIGSITAVTHFRTPDAMRTNSCCCMPFNAARQLHTFHIVIIIFAFLSFCSAVVQAVLSDPNMTTRAAAAVDAAVSFVCIFVAVCTLRALRRLNAMCLQDETMWAPSAPHQNAPVSVFGPGHNPHQPDHPVATVGSHPGGHYPGGHYPVYPGCHHHQLHHHPQQHRQQHPAYHQYPQNHVVHAQPYYPQPQAHFGAPVYYPPPAHPAAQHQYPIHEQGSTPPCNDAAASRPLSERSVCTNNGRPPAKTL